MNVFWGLMIPFFGTTLGAACVFFMKKELNPLVQKGFLGFAAGVMVAASVWSLLIPAMDMNARDGTVGFYSCGSWIFDWNWIFAFYGPHSASSSSGQ